MMNVYLDNSPWISLANGRIHNSMEPLNNMVCWVRFDLLHRPLLLDSIFQNGKKELLRQFCYISKYKFFAEKNLAFYENMQT